MPTADASLRGPIMMTLPVSLKGKYQLVILAAEGDAQLTDYVSRLDQALSVSFILLGVDMKKFLVRAMPGTTGSYVDRRMPTVAVYFGSSPSPKLSTQEAK